MGLSAKDLSGLRCADVLRVVSLDNSHSFANLGSGLRIGDLVFFSGRGLGDAIIAYTSPLNMSSVGVKLSPNDVELVSLDDLKVNREVCTTVNKVGVISNSEKQPIKSDGGSSGYYFTKLPKELIDDIVERGGIEIKDIVRHCFYNDADCKDIIKALKRIQESLRGGGKEGISVQYDANKILFFANELKESLGVEK